ncbi:MAG: cation acetate symporter [Deltaproteobacteria bacterium]|nr:cation acetate symporter [Deltaproteobacteria bacterium]MBW2019486.1 cation acetate symporter [Deltaproteobacteria bacterium]MBW2074323.1 cation acetate symporter [Deltaproteobacteria bacterium]
MSILAWTYIMVGITFSLYIGIAWASRVRDTKGFYVAGGGIPALANGMATGADWMSAASFISMAGLISFMGYTGCIYLMGWTGGYVLLALLLAPYLRKFGKYTVPDFVGDRYYSNTARAVALICAIFVSFTYVAGQMRGVGIVFSRFLQVDVNTGVLIGMAIVFLYAVLGGMKGITWTQVAQYCVLIIAYLIPAIAISIKTTGHFIPQIGLGSPVAHGTNAGVFLLDVLDNLNRDLGFAEYTSAFGPGNKSMIDVFCITFALMVGTAGLPHVIVRFYTVPNVKSARLSAGFALMFIAILYTTAPSVAGFARYNMIDTLNGKEYKAAPTWLKNWEETGLVAWIDKNNDGIIQYRAGKPFAGKPKFTEEFGNFGQRLVSNRPTTNPNELYIDRDIMVLANPEIANLPAWVVALVAAGGLAAALSTASGLLLVIASSVSHDLYYRLINPNATEKQRLLLGRLMIGVAVCVAGYFGIHPPGFVAQVVAFAFGLAASSFFPILVLGIFNKRTTKEGAIVGMASGIIFTAFYIIQIKFLGVKPWLFGISAEGIGTVGMLINLVLTLIVSKFTPEPPQEIQDMVENIRYPRGKGKATAIST